MIFGTPWSKGETDILIESISKTYKDIQTDLKLEGYHRSIEAISRKCRRLNAKQKKTISSEDNIAIDWFEEEVVTPVIPLTEKNWTIGSLPLKSDGITKFVMLNDVHVPHNVPLENVFQFIKDYGPNYILLVGDIVNNDPFSHWDKAKPLKAKKMPQPRPYYEQCNKEFYRPLRIAAGASCSIGHWVGNHEWWANRAIEEMPEGEGYWEVWNNVEGIDFWVPNKQVANLGKLHFMHGDVFRGQNPARKAMNLYRRNLRFGHFHNIEEASHTSPIDINDRHTARCCGTLEKPNPGFMENRPHDWVLAFTYGIVMPDGNFHDHTAVITEGQFMANGKIYG